MGVPIGCADMKTSHEQADVVIPQQVVHAVSERAKYVTVICDDTVVFVLLLPYYPIKYVSCTHLVEATSAERTVVDIAPVIP